MSLILSAEEKLEIKKLLLQSLETSELEIISLKNNLVTVEMAPRKISKIPKNKKMHKLHSIFPSISRLTQVFDFIELNYHQPIRLKEVAQAVGYSPGYLTNLVRNLTGKTVNHWIIERRITEAKYLLLETDDSIEQIALKIGYQNINHFYCQFRNYCQNTPRAWRDKQRCQQNQKISDELEYVL